MQERQRREAGKQAMGKAGRQVSTRIRERLEEAGAAEARASAASAYALSHSFPSLGTHNKHTYT